MDSVCSCWAPSWSDYTPTHTRNGTGTSTDLVPTLLGMYDSLIGRAAPTPSAPAEPPPAAPPPSAAATAPTSTHAPATPSAKRLSTCLDVTRPLSVSSIASSSSSSSSSGASSCSGRRLPKCSAYLASIESLDDSEEEQAGRQKASGSQGSGDSGVCSPPPPRAAHVSSPWPPPHSQRPRYCDPHISYMDRVVMEIIDTEAVYVRDLQQIIEGYLEKWRSSPDCPLTEKQLEDLFNNIEEIYMFNRGFLEELEQCGLDPVKVARCFVRKNAGFSIYTQYCTNYPRTVSLLTELMRQEDIVRLFRERQASLQHTLPLGSYLLKPVQRILKYHLLLQNIVKHYVYEAEGYSDIVDALSTMTGIAHHINNMKRRHEHAVRVQEIQSLLYGWEGEDLTTFGELCAEGAFRMYGAKAMRHAFLFDKMLLITKKKEEGILGYKTHIMCSNLMLIESVPGEPFSFHVIPFDNPRLQYTLQARNLEQKREWTMQLKRVILENYNAVIPSHARQLVMELGQNRTDDEIMADKSAPKRQHSAPEYLEKRKQENRRKSETGLRYRLRRSRKSDTGLSSEEQTDQHRGRRASSSSRDRSQSREGLRSVSPAKIKERFGSWRRKSEPGCYSSGSQASSSKTDTPTKLTVPQNTNISIESTEDIGASREAVNEDTSKSLEVVEQTSLDISAESESCDRKLENVVADTDVPFDDKDVVTNEEEAKTLEEIVGQLLMQNHEFQKILKKQQRHVSLRHRYMSSNGTTNPKDETTDTENEDDGIYETLAITSTAASSKPTSGQSYRAHRHAHMRALRNEQKSISSSISSRSKRQSVHLLQLEAKDSLGSDADYVTLKYERDTSCALRESVGQHTTFQAKHAVTERTMPNSSGERSPYHTFSVNNLRVETDKTDSHKCKLTQSSSYSAETKEKGNSSGNYDNLQQIWESVKRQQEEIRRLAESEDTNRETSTPNLRRTQSFTCQESLGAERDDLPLEPSFLPANSEMSIDTLNIPTLPAVWLKLQGDHLATPNKKSGSLPRSFQLNHDSPNQAGNLSSSTMQKFGRTEKDIGKGNYRTRLFGRDGRSCHPDRPFTIASDKAAEIDFDDIDRYMVRSGSHSGRHRFPVGGDTTEEDSTTEYTATPDASLDNLNVHPEYKIYRPSVSKASLGRVLGRLSGRSSSEALELEVEHEREQLLQCERHASRLVYALARQYSKTLKQRIRTIMGEDAEDCVATPATPGNRSPSPAPASRSSNPPILQAIYKQGSSSLGARIAHCSEYANPRQLYPNIHQSKPASSNGNEGRPDSVLSVSSNFTSSSDGDKTSGFGGSVDTAITSPRIDSEAVRLGEMPCVNMKRESDMSSEKSDELHLSDGSGDSYYERSFEAIESFLENEVFRDSAVFSDHEELCDNAAASSTNNVLTPAPTPVQKPVKIPPPVPAKPVRLTRKKAAVQDCRNSNTTHSSTTKSADSPQGTDAIHKSIQERRKELELWRSGGTGPEDECDTSSQHSTASTVIEVSPVRSVDDVEEAPTPKGWVKHIVGKLQGQEESH
ncbi:uncharacterized protein LOC126334820 isoform X1 [Schistocerca gregaria]|uniref:uncharacterized protein LOC126334820 isoform X1 n=1 Tax=Schistocerca gregaria TaxID=7010 RepID=UPI00211EF20D|nr:uncharacterized protein LOC126334820 isoform X1 [Schistocerca gregaria]